MNQTGATNIKWEFTVTLQTKVTRYGRVGETYYRQFLPAGIEVPEIYPPRAIAQRLYEMAKRQSMHKTT